MREQESFTFRLEQAGATYNVTVWIAGQDIPPRYYEVFINDKRIGLANKLLFDKWRMEFVTCYAFDDVLPDVYEKIEQHMVRWEPKIVEEKPVGLRVIKGGKKE